MDEFPGLLVRDSGFRSQGKSSPMAASTSIPSSKERSGWNSDSLLGDHEGFFENKNAQNYDEVFGIPYTSPHPASKNLQDYDDVFGGPPKSVSSSSPSLGFDSIFQGLNGSAAKPSSIPVYDKPVYDDDIFDGVPGIKSSSSVNYDDVFTSISSASNRASPPLDDLLGGFGRMEPESKGSVEKRPRGSKEQDLSAFDDLIPGFGGSSPKQEREPPEINHQQSATPSAKPTVSMAEDPFVVLETTSTSAYSSSGFVDPLEHISRSMNSRSTKIDASSGSGRAFDDIDAFDGISKSVPLYMSDLKNDRKNSSPLRTVNNMSSGHPPAGMERSQKSSMENFENILPKMEPVDNYRESQQTHFEKPIKSYDSLKSAGRSGVQSSDANVNPYENNATSGLPPKSNKHIETVDDVWLTVAEVPLFTQPTSASPPSRPPPPFVIKQAPGEKTDRGASGSLNANRKDEEFSFPESSQTYQFPDLVNDFGKVSSVSPIDELEDFAMAKPQTYPNERSEFLPNEEETETNSSAAASAAAIKEAMDEAEVKFKHAREVRERERDAKSVRSRDPEQQERDEKVIPDAQDREDTEKEERLDRERQQEREEKEKERKRLDEERQTELERERTRQVMGEARGRVAAEAHLKAEKAAVEKANAQARERDRAAYLRALAEARGRAAAEAKERAEKAEAKERAEKADAEAKEKADLEAKEKAAAESREKAAAEAREKAAAEAQEKEKRERTNLLRAQRAAVERATAEFRERATAALKEKQHKNENDLESIFGMGAQANSTRKQRATTSETGFDPQVRNKVGSEGVRRTSASCSSTDREASSTTNIVDDLASIFGDSPSSGEFPEVDGESEERRRARLERHQRVHQRTVKALADKNERESQTQKEQEERHRIAETLDIEIKRWAAGKEGNLRALLSTLQYVLWPECGWQPVSLIDLITPISVKKVYRKATLCIHPDKVQQKGANLQQKYIAEKVFDLLKEAWNKLNSEEFF